MIHSITYWLKSAVVFLVVFFSATAFSVNFPASPNPFHYVNDYTDTLSVAEKNALENKLIAFSRETSSQIAVVMVPTTGEYEISQYTLELGDKWGIGRKQLNNGVLMLIAKADRKIFIAVGQGLEGVLTDAFLAQIIRNAITPSFKQNQYAAGINNGLDYIIAASKGEFAAEEEEESTLEQIIPFLMIAFFILAVVLGELNWRKQPYISPTNNHQLEQVIRQSTLGRNRRSGGGFGGGFGSGGFGGGSSGGGFGGGSFGGGGAGGSW